jgi:hypothetical protein
MSIKIIPYSNEMYIHPVSEVFAKLIKSTKNNENTFSRFLGICCLDKEGRKMVLYKDLNDEYIYFMNVKLDEAFIHFLRGFLNPENIDLKVSYELIRIANMIELDKISMFELFRIIGWPSGKRGIYSFDAIGDFPGKLKELFFNKKISLKEACLIHKTFNTDTDAVLSLIPKVKTYSERNQIIRYICEYAQKTKVELKELIKEITVKRNKDILQTAFELRYPLYSEVKLRFDDFIGKLGLPGNVKVIHDANFEKDEYELTVKFRDLTDLKNKVSQIESVAEKYLKDRNNQDLFDLKILFNNKKDEQY